MANKQHGTRQKLVFRGGTAPPGKGVSRTGSGPRKAGPPDTGKPARPRQPRKLIGSSDS